MLGLFEIIALLAGCKIIGDKVRERGRKALGFQVMLVACCVVFDFAGVILAWKGGVRELGPITFWGLFGASWGAAISLKIVSMLPDLSRPLDFTTQEFDYAPNLPASEETIDPSNPYASPRDH